MDFDISERTSKYKSSWFMEDKKNEQVSTSFTLFMEAQKNGQVSTSVTWFPVSKKRKSK